VPLEYHKGFPVEPIVLCARLRGIVIAGTGDKLPQETDRSYLRKPPPQVIIQAYLQRFVETADSGPGPTTNETGRLADGTGLRQALPMKGPSRIRPDRLPGLIDDVGVTEHGYTLRVVFQVSDHAMEASGHEQVIGIEPPQIVRLAEVCDPFINCCGLASVWMRPPIGQSPMVSADDRD
jgi:hypothetical protein